MVFLLNAHGFIPFVWFIEAIFFELRIQGLCSCCSVEYDSLLYSFVAQRYLHNYVRNAKFLHNYWKPESLFIISQLRLALETSEN